MTFFIAVGAATVTVAASMAGIAIADTTPLPPGAAVEVASVYGRTLGAALECPEIGRDRVTSVTKKALAHLKALAPNESERMAAGQRLSNAADDGALAVRNGETICPQAEADLDNLDHELPPLTEPKSPTEAKPPSQTNSAPEPKPEGDAKP